MTDEKLDQILKQALAPEISDRDLKVQKRRKGNLRKFIKTGKTAAAALAVMAVGIGGLGYFNPVLAAKIPLIGKIFEKIEEDVTYSGDYTDKGTVLTTEDAQGNPDPADYSVADQGITLTASEIYCDGYSIFFTMKVEAEDADFTHIPEHYTLNGADDADAHTAAGMYIHGTWRATAGASASESADTTGALRSEELAGMGADISENADADTDASTSSNEGASEDTDAVAGASADSAAWEKIESNLEGKVIDSHTFVGMMKVNLTEKAQISGTLHINISSIGYDNDQMLDGENISASHSTEGAWDMALPFTVDEADVQTIAVGETHGDITLDDVVVSPYRVIVHTTAPGQQVELTDETREKLLAENPDLTDAQMYEMLGVRYAWYDMLLFTQDGEMLSPETARVGAAEFAVQGKEIKTLQLFIFDNSDAWAQMKEEGVKSSAAQRAVIAKEIPVE